MLDGQVAIITGGSRGLGKAIAQRFAENGAALVLVATDEERLEKAATEIGQAGHGVQIAAGDVAVPEFSEAVMKQTLDAFGKVDILVNCAGVITRTMVEDLSLDDWYRVIDVNLHGTFHMCRAVLPFMREAGFGRVLNITSQMARLPHPGASPSYEVSKAGQTALTRHLALQYAPYNITVNALAPGSIDTQLAATMDPEIRAGITAAIPMGRLGLPMEVADCALFLVSSMADYVTGTTVDVNGGSVMCP